jgi:hypothetical protein
MYVSTNGTHDYLYFNTNVPMITDVSIEIKLVMSTVSTYIHVIMGTLVFK